MSDFPSATLNAVCDFQNGGTPSKAVERYFTGDIPWITGADLVEPVAQNARSFITEEAITSSATNKVPAGTVLLVTRTSVGKVAIAGKELCFSQDITALLPNSAKLDAGYLVHFLRTKEDHFSRYARGATIKGITRQVVADLVIPLPPPEEQRRIAAILDQAETLRTQRRTALALLDSLTQSLFLDMFGDDEKGEPRFAVAALADVLEMPLQNGAYYPKEEYVSEGGVEMVHMSDAFNGIVSRGSLKRVNCSDADLSKYGLNESDILLARRSLTYEGAAKPCLVPPAAEPLIFESSFIRVTPDKKKLSVPYLFHYLGNATIREKRVRPFVTQSTISGINQSNLERVAVVVPPLPLQQTFATRIASIEALKTTHRHALAALDALFASLQQRAFAGQL